MQRIAMASIAVALLVMGLKYAAYLETGSIALLSDALESIVNVITGVIALWAITVSYKPADKDHPFGHHKAEYFSAVVEGVLIVVAALLILREAWSAIENPRGLDTPLAGLAINGVATILNFGWALFLLRTGASRRSPALTADGRHILADVVTSVGVLVGLLIAALTGWAILDPLLAALVAVNILREGWLVVTTSLSSLMDQAIDPQEEVRVREVISANADGAIEVHDLKTRLAGRAMFIEFHLVVPSAMTVGISHAICDRIEDALHAAFESSRVTIHVEPEDEAKQVGVPVL
ncbi:cation diffusion facilitator family transporter [Mangrovibrevibacter kandeliae]|uniref:cation diffusion facilitator family transporter n=1 Tax=Mangrovibrevibacter kandeliae TaxID=2968473 RepID=UPI002119732B|nr:cation diffusion facilitator family transporter [Aurantimonas sp. CSK15Z-1]MCQ8780985.1 cation diffusion facilitator family transporter [Aurantimonas sp. CSK15Z-1]